MKSASSSQRIPLHLKVREAAQQFARLVRGRAPWRKRSFAHLQHVYDEYDAILRRYSGKPLNGSAAFEIGCGQRPYRLFYLLASGVRAEAVDLDHVMFNFNAGKLASMLKENGVERTAKSVLRYALFDRFENGKLQAFLAQRAGGKFCWPVHLIRRGSAADPAMWPKAPIDFVYSEDVFEHIPGDVLPDVCKLLSGALSDRGIAFVRPMVFTGIEGGHTVDWYDAHVERPRACPPWDHLRQGKYPANTYLNRLSLEDYRRLFSVDFDILEERVRNPDLGRQYMTAELRQELAAYPDEELFSNHVGFILRPRR